MDANSTALDFATHPTSIWRFEVTNLRHARDVIDQIFQDELFPKENVRLRENKLVERMHEKGISRALARTAIDELVADGVFRAEDFVNLQIFVPLSGGDQTDTATPDRYLYTSAARWRDHLRKGHGRRGGKQRCVIALDAPADASWQQLRMSFLDGHIVKIKIGVWHQILHYGDLGFSDARNKQPTKQWELLQLFAKHYGMLTWDQRDASRSHQKRRETLARQLKQVLPLAGEPIVLTDDGKGWQCVFAIEPDA